MEDSRRYYPFYAVFDTEAYFNKSSLPNNTKTMTWEAEHKLASVSVASNIPGYTEPVCFVNENGIAYDVVSKMMNYLENLSELCYAKLRCLYDDIFEAIEEKRTAVIAKEKSVLQKKDLDNLELKFARLEKDLYKYLAKLLVFGFNSGAYDIPLIKQELVQYLVKHNRKISFPVKKGNAYMCLKTDDLRFLDVTNYLAPGFSYSAYLKAMDIKTKKLFWIYENSCH